MRSHTFIVLLICFLIGLNAEAQTERDTNPSFLKKPADWGFEKIPFPLGFAPDIPFEGYEELRFAPNWRDQNSPNYFSYAFVIHATNQKKVSKNTLQKMLEMYYRGLSKAVAEGPENDLDFSQIYVTVAQTRSERKGTKNYKATIQFLDTFNSGELVLLYMDIETIRDRNTKSTYIVSIVSSTEREEPIWNKLRELKAHIELPISK